MNIAAFLIKSYYHGLSLHGVLNVLVWTTFCISGFLTFVMARVLGTPLQGMGLGWTAFGLMVGGLVLAAVPLLANQAIAQQRQAFEPLCDVPPPQHLRLHTTQAPALTAEKARRQLTSRAPLLAPSEGKGRGEDLRCLQ
jgi:hypothetical protein